MLSGGSPGSAENTLAPSTTGTSVPAGQGAGVPVWLLMYAWRPSEPAATSHIVVFCQAVRAIEVSEHGYEASGRFRYRAFPYSPRGKVV